ncbi:TIGR02281 family clan AA aspartic protease [Novosphingobium sp. FSY-8]|uniref:TIGR02281 family clan AA aspartic protease n=1 Tax=Novosphingobium ovatum TaxID=1908523 RepID=A0ABW9XG93_9SPHN|nr:retropepsin-like aspartic protease [Novosphingobium ovatum]NBC37567.1 TIGR02281 family clan AA aspartic protease [Novosphingobium ovatum]
MGQLITRALAATFVMSVLAVALAPRGPHARAPRQAQAFAALSTSADTATGSGNPWDINAAPPQAAPASAPSAPQARVIGRDDTGQFHIDGLINGQSTRFLIDTGADIVAISTQEAQRLALRIDQTAPRAMLRSASGVTSGSYVTIERLYVAGAELHNVRAVVMDGLEGNLLGQSALRQMGRVELRGDAMIIEGKR